MWKHPYRSKLGEIKSGCWSFGFRRRTPVEADTIRVQNLILRFAIKKVLSFRNDAGYERDFAKYYCDRTCHYCVNSVIPFHKTAAGEEVVEGATMRFDSLGDD